MDIFELFIDYLLFTKDPSWQYMYSEIHCHVPNTMFRYLRLMLLRSSFLTHLTGGHKTLVFYEQHSNEGGM